MRNKASVGFRVVRALFLALWLIVCVFPLYWILVTSLKSPGAINQMPIQYWPQTLSLQSFRNLFALTDFKVYVINSALVAVATATVVTAVSLLSAYVLSRYDFKGRGAVLGAFLVTQMVPTFIALGPLYMLMSALGMVDSLIGLSLVYMAMFIPFATIMLRGFFANVPTALDEAAQLDGCNRFETLVRIIIPVMGPGIVASFIFSFVNSWNELFLSVTLLNLEQNRTIPSALNSFVTTVSIDWSPLSAAAVVTIIPTLLVFGLSSRFIIDGLTAGAVKN